MDTRLRSCWRRLSYPALAILFLAVPLSVAAFEDQSPTRLPAAIDDSYVLAQGDVDHDGDADLIVGNGGSPLMLLNDAANGGDGAFTASAGLPALDSRTLGVVLADLDGDGDLDLFLANASGQDRLLINNGTGAYLDATASRLPPDADIGTAAVAADLDDDDDLDLVVANRGTRNRLLFNDGSGHFTDLSDGRLAADTDPTTSVAVADINGDGAVDLFFANDDAQNRLHRNNGLGFFSDATAGSLPTVISESLGAFFADLDGDGDADLVLANGSAGPAVLLNNGGLFTNESAARLPAGAQYAIGVAVGDIDFNGSIDLVIANAGQDDLLLNNGSGTFSASTLPADLRRSFAALLVDADRDFDLDLVLATPAGQNRFLVNDLAFPRIRLSWAPTYVEVTDPVTFAVEVFDEDGVAATEMKIRKPDTSEETLSLSGGSASFVPTLAGVHLATVTAQDSLGNVGTRSVPFTVLVQDTTAPSVTTTVTPTAILVGQSVQIQVAATDNRGVMDRRLEVGGVPVPLDTTGRATYVAVATGLQTAIGYAADAAGNEGTASATFTVSPDTVAPTVALSLSAGTVDLLNPVTITASATDNVAVSGLTLTVTGPTDPGGTVLRLDAAGQASYTPYVPGTHTVTARATDPAGNLTTRTASFEAVGTPDTTPPTVTLTVAPRTVVIGNTVTITVAATDAVAVATRGLTVNGTPLPLNAAGTATYLPPLIGTYTAVARVTDPTGNETVETTSFRAIDPASDNTPPTVSITAPTDSAEVSGTVTITGTADDPTLVQYSLAFAPLESSTFTTFATGDAAVVGATLGTLDTSLLQNGYYQVRLAASDANGRTASVTTLINVVGQLKLGVFTVSFQDKTIPVGKLPVSVTRTYDSRKRGTVGDFGYGWSVELSRAELVANRIGGTAWEQVSLGGFIPSYQLVPTQPHFVTIRLGDNKEVKFSARPDPQTRQLYPFTTYGPTGMRYEPVGDSDVGTLTPSGKDPLWFLGDEILDEDFDVYNPSGFSYRAPDGYQYNFTSTQQASVRYKLTSVIDPSGLRIDITPSGFTRSDGLGVTFVRDGQNRITSITDAAGRTVTYQYDSAGNLAAVIDAENNRAEIAYNAQHYLTEIRDPAGNPVQRNEYDDDGRLTAITDAAGNRIAMEYDLDANTQITRDRRNNPTIHRYDNAGNVVAETRFPSVNGVVQAAVTLRQFDANQQVTRETLPDGTVNTFEYDRFGNVTREVKDLGGLNLTTTSTYNTSGKLLTQQDARGNTASFTYDLQGHRDSATDHEGKITLYAYSAGRLAKQTDPTGDYTLFEYDGVGNLVAEARWNGNQTVNTSDDTLVRRTEYDYDTVGNKLAETVLVDVGGAFEDATTSFTYDKNARVLTETDPVGNVKRFVYDRVGQRTAEIDALGNRTAYTHDALGNLIRVDYPDGGFKLIGYDADGNRNAVTDENGHTVRYTFDALNRAIAIQFPDATLPDGGTQTSSRVNLYDAVGNLIGEIDELGNRTDHQYDRVGRRIATQQPEVFNAATGAMVRPMTAYGYDGNGNRTTVMDANGHRTDYVFDKENRPVQTQFADGRSTSRGYDALGRETSRTDAAGQTTRFSYDALGRQTKVSLPPTTVGNPRPETLFTYNELGKVLTQTDANGHQTSFTYDLAGNRLSHTLPGLETETFGYDAANRMVSHTDFNGVTTGFVYDAMGRRVRENYPGGTHTDTAWFPGGQRLSVTDATGTTSFVYDERDRLVRRTDADGLTITYGYTATGKVGTVTTASGATTYTYDALDRLSSVTDPDGNAATHGYDLVGNLADVDHANGTRTHYSYNSRNQLTAVEQFEIGGNRFAMQAYTLDANGLRTRIDELSMGNAVNFVYDGNARLVRETRLGSTPYDIQYAYDPVGNRIRMDRNGVVTTYVYDSNDRLNSSGAGVYSYDDNGNLTRVAAGTQVTTLAYDANNRLVRSVGPAGTNNYGYDADGNRILKSGAGGQVRYLLDIRNNTGLVQVLEERGDSGLLARYTYGLSRLTQDRAGALSHYHPDGLGSIRALTDAYGALTDTYVYDGYGNEIASTGSTENPYRFAGEPFDPNLGFYYLRARYYDPATGRFISMDPAAGDPQSPQSLHRYLYANDNPINFVDPTGQFTLIEINISISIQSTIQSAYTSNLVKFFFTAAKIAFCTIEPAYRMQDIGLDMMFKGLPGGELLIEQSRDQIAAGYKAIGQAAQQVYIDTFNDVVDFKIEFKGVLKDVYDWASGDGDISSLVPIPDEVAKVMEFYDELSGWFDKFENAYRKVKDGYGAATSGDPCQQFTFLEENADTILGLMPDF